MSHKELLLASKLLAIAADEFANHGCNDIDLDLLNSIAFTEAEKAQISLEFSQWNERRSDPEDMVPFEWIGDSSWMSFLSHKLAMEATEGLKKWEGV